MSLKRSGGTTPGIGSELPEDTSYDGPLVLDGNEEGDILVWDPGSPTWVGLPLSATASGYWLSALPINLWDNSLATHWNSGATTPTWNYADFGTAVAANRIVMRSNSVARTWTVAGSNNATDWYTVVASITATVGSDTTADFTEESWQYWRVWTALDWTDPFKASLFLVADQWAPEAPSKSTTLMLGGM